MMRWFLCRQYGQVVVTVLCVGQSDGGCRVVTIVCLLAAMVRYPCDFRFFAQERGGAKQVLDGGDDLSNCVW